MARLRRLGVLLLLAAAPLAAPAEIHRWTDERGVVHFSDRIEGVPAESRRDVSEEFGELGVAEDPSDPATAPGEAPGAAAPAAPTSPPLPLPGELGEMGARLAGLGLLALAAVAVAGLGASLALMAFALRLACRVVGEEVPGFGRALGIAALQLAAGFALGAALAGAVLAGAVDPASPALQGGQLLASFGIQAVVIRALLGLAFVRALVVALVALLITMAVGLVLGLGIALLAVLAAGLG